jgi:hypothetical protein
MLSERLKRLRRITLFAFLGLLVLCVGTAGVFAVMNRQLPTHSQVVERLSEAEKARLAEAFHLREQLGDAVWTGWGQADIPIIVYNEAYAFLIGYPDPAAGWSTVPWNAQRGGPWELVPGDEFQDQPYYRQPLPDPDATPENFTVLVGDRLVATLQTKEYAEIAFVTGFPEELPPPLQPFFPYQLFWKFLGGDTEVYLGALEHEAFHAFQGMIAPERLAQAEVAVQLEGQYPWEDEASEAAWREELDLLVSAVKADTDAQAAELAREFLNRRDQRRETHGVSPELVDFERQREWLEGLAKYSELELLRQAVITAGYEPVLAGDPDFEAYAGSLRHWSQQLDEAGRSALQEGEIRFYYSGFAQAALLDRFDPAWKESVFSDDVWLEELLAEALPATD